jgi:hypothetical protein
MDGRQEDAALRDDVQPEAELVVLLWSQAVQ